MNQNTKDVDLDEGIRYEVGEARQVLRRLPEASVHCVATSPPYYSLRDYGLEPTVWGETSRKETGCAFYHLDPNNPDGCLHQWSPCGHIQGGSQRQGSSSARGNRTNIEAQIATGSSQGELCEACGAWRGCLGLEPTLALYVAHLCEVLDEVARVLRPDGTLWLNLGDSYARDPRKGQHRPGDTGKQAAVYDRGGGRASGGTNGLPEKNLLGVPWRVAFALQERGWLLRSDIVWSKTNPCPESVLDRPTRSHELVFLLSRRPDYFYDHEGGREPCVAVGKKSGNKERKVATEGERSRTNTHLGSGFPYEDTDGLRNRRTVWTLNSEALRDEHYAAMPTALVEPCILAGTSGRGVCGACGTPPAWDRRERLWRWGCDCAGANIVPATVLDPFAGSGTVGIVARRLGRRAILIDQKAEYREIAKRRFAKEKTHGLLDPV